MRVAQLIFAAMVVLFLLVVITYQNGVVQNQQTTIRTMTTNPACMTATPAEVQHNAEEWRKANPVKPTGDDPAAAYQYAGGVSGRI